MKERTVRKKWALSVFCLLLAWLLGRPVTYGQEEKQADSLQYEVSVTLKLIQVYVSYRDGTPVQDLTKEDFVLYDNGSLMTITDFEIHRITQVDQRETEQTPRLSRKFYLFLDSYRNDGMGLIKARKTALHFMDTQLQPDDEVGLLSYAIGRGLIVHVPMTKDHDTIREAVQSVKLFPGITPANDGQTEMREALDFAESLSDFAVSLRYVPGYKNIILFSAGLPLNLLHSDDPRLLSEHERMAKELASSSCAIFTIDTQGQRDLVEGREQKGDAALRRMSSLSGGRYFSNVDYREDISEDIQNSTGYYYVLGYSVDEAWDGKYHEIKVEVTRKGVRIQAQKGYYNPKAFAKFSRLEKRLNLMDLARNPSPQFGLPLILPSTSGVWINSNAFFLAEIIPGDLEEILAHRAELFTLIFDKEGELLAEGAKDVDFREDPPERICAYLFCPQLPGSYEYIIILRNKRTGAAAKAKNTITSSDSNPLLFVPENPSLCLTVDLVPADENLKIRPTRLESIAPQIGQSVSPLIYELDKDITILYAVFSGRDELEGKKDLKFTAQLRSRTTDRAFPLNISKRDDIQTLEKNTLVFQLELSPLPSGEYDLEISSSTPEKKDSPIFSQTVFIK